MAINREAPLTWLLNNLSNVTPAAPATATSTVYVDTLNYVTAANPNPDPPFWAVWYDENLTTYGRFTSNTHTMGWEIYLGVYLHIGALDRFTQKRALLKQVGEEWEKAFLTWITTNRTLGDTVSGIGNDESMLLTLPLSPLPFWNGKPGFGALFVIPLMEIV